VRQNLVLVDRYNGAKSDRLCAVAHLDHLAALLDEHGSDLGDVATFAGWRSNRQLQSVAILAEEQLCVGRPGNA